MYDDCFKYGINGGCNITCPMLQDGDCTEPEENYILIRQLKMEKILKKFKNN